MKGLFVLPLAMSLTGCGLFFGPPMQRGDFERAKAACELTGASFEEGNYLTGKPATIHAPRGVSPTSWDDKGDCVARLFGGDGVSKATSVNFIVGFHN